jgi:antitoxin HigA-1
MVKKLAPIHPGEILNEDFLKPLEISVNRLALDLHVPASRIAQLVHRRRAVTPDIALRLARYFGTTPEFWLNLQSKFDRELAEHAFLPRIRRVVRPRKLK